MKAKAKSSISLQRPLKSSYAARAETTLASVVSALAAYDDFSGLCKEIDDFAFAFIAPLGAYEDGVGHGRKIEFW